MLAEALADRASFRRFCGFAREEDTPERTAFVRFRRQLVENGLDQSLFAAITRDLEQRGACVRKSLPPGYDPGGTLIDATVIGSASKGDKEAAWAKHKSRAPAHGYKAHISADKETGIIRAVETTPANEADVSVAPSLIPDRPGAVYGDKAYDALSVEAAIKAKGGTPRLLRRAIAGSKPQRSKNTTGRCGRSGQGSKKSSAPGNAAIAFARCDGSGSPRQDCKSTSRPLPTT